MDPLSQEFYGLIAKSKTRSPALDEMVEILTLLGKLPTIDQKMRYGDTLGEYDRQKNNISFHPSYGLNINTIPHEFTHAIDTQMNDYISNYGKSPTSQQQQLLQARDKLNPATSKLIPANVDDPYRFSPRELRAYGVGNMEGPRTLDAVFKVPKAPPHVDATMATEAAILRDLFKRALKTNGTNR